MPAPADGAHAAPKRPEVGPRPGSPSRSLLRDPRDCSAGLDHQNLLNTAAPDPNVLKTWSKTASVAQGAAARADSGTLQISREKGSKSRESRDETHNCRWGRRTGRARENVGPSGGRTRRVDPREKLGGSLVLWLLRFNTDYRSSIGLSSFLGQSSLEATI